PGCTRRGRASCRWREEAPFGKCGLARWSQNVRDERLAASGVVAFAGGDWVGRVRLQWVRYLDDLELVLHLGCGVGAVHDCRVSFAQLDFRDHLADVVFL